eukprot:gene378-476_t
MSDQQQQQQQHQTPTPPQQPPPPTPPQKQNNNNANKEYRASTMINSGSGGATGVGSDLNQQAGTLNVQREIYKQLELLLLKKKAGDTQRITVRQGLLVTIPQVERVQQMTSQQVTHSLEVLSNVLVQISSQTLHHVCEVLIKMCDSYLDDPYNVTNNNNKKPDLPSFKEEFIESDVEVPPINNNTSNSLLNSSGGFSIVSPVIVPSGANTSSTNLLSPIIQSSNTTPTTTPDMSSSIVGENSTSSQTPQQPTLSPPQHQLSPPIQTALLSPPIQTTTTSPTIYKQVSEDTPLYHLLNTLYIVLLSHQPSKLSTSLPTINPDDSPQQQLLNLPPKVITFFFNLLQCTFSPAIRYKAASCLQVISVVSLDLVTQMFITKLQSGKSDDFYREYSTIQKASKYLEFGFFRTSQIEGTSQYFAKLLIEMEKVSRAVFVQAMCYTISKAYPRMFNANTNYSLVPEPFWNITNKMYDTILKWSKKSKLKPICVRTLFSMVGCSSEFMSSRGTDLLSLWASVYKETSSKQQRKAYLECLVQYFNGFKFLYGTEAKAPLYQSQMEFILPVLFPKKSTPTATEMPLLFEVVMSMGRFSLSVVVSKYLLGILSPPSKSGSSSDFSLEAKGIILRVLHQLNVEFNESMRNYDRMLWAVLDPLFASYDGEPTPIKYILLNFPALCSLENVKDTADKITKWTWHVEQDIATMATSSITKYLASQPHSTFPAILLQMLNFITNYFGDLGGLCKVVKNMCLVLQEFINLHYYMNGDQRMSASQGIDQTTWKNLRETCEGVSLYLLSSVVAPLWAHVFEFITLSGHDIFREIDKVLGVVYLADFLPISIIQQPNQAILANSLAITTMIPTLNLDLTYFLQIQSGQLQNCISWAWARLRKRWHPKSQPIGWKNHLAFLLLSLRLNNEAPETTAVEEQLLTEVLTCYFQEREGRTGEELSLMVSELSLYLHPSCYDTVFRFIEQERSRDLKKKKKEVFYTLEHVIVYASQLVDRLTVVEYDSIQSTRTALREMTYFWITNPQIFNSLSLSTKNQSSKLFKNFLLLDSKSTLPKGEISLNKASYTKLTFQCLQTLIEHIKDQDHSLLQELELNIQKSIQVLISESCMDDFKTEVIPYLIKCFNQGPHIYSILAENLSIFLRRSPKYLNEYIEKSFENEKSSIASVLFLKSLTINFSPEFYLKWSHNCSPERLVHLCLFHMVSSNEESRNLAIKMANELSMRVIVSSDELTRLSPHFNVVSTSNLPLHIYSRSSLLYSNSMSSKFPWITPGLFDEANNCYQHLPFVHKQSVLTLLAPWTRNFWTVLSVGEGLTVQSSDITLEALFNLTLQAKLVSTSNLTALEVLWGELISSGDANGRDATVAVLKKIIDFLKEKHHSDVNQHSLQWADIPQIRDCCRMIVNFICRRSSNHWLLVMEYLIQSLRYYPSLPVSPSEYAPEALAEATKEEDATALAALVRSEEAVLSFFEDLSFEFLHHDVLAIPNLLPVLLVNILYVYGSQSKKTLNNILQSLAIQQPSIPTEIKDEALQLIDVDLSKWKEKQRTSLIKILLTSLGDQVIDIWEQYTLQFAIRAPNLSISMSALDWYSGIRDALGTKKDGMDGLLGLCCGLWKSSVSGDLGKMHKILNLLTSIITNTSPNQQPQSETSYAIIVRLGSILLHTSYLNQFSSALMLLYKTIQTLEETSNQTVQSRITEEMIDILGAGMKPENVISLGIAHPKTSILTLWFAKTTCQFWEKKPTHQSSSIVMAVLLAAATMATMSPEDPLTREFIEYMMEPPASSFSNLLHHIYPYYHYNVVHTPGSTQPLPLRDLARNLCRDFITNYPSSPDLVSSLISSVTDMTKALVEASKENDASFLLMFINEFLQNYASGHPSVTNIPSQELVDFITLMIDVSQRSSSVLTREEAQNTIPFIMNNLPPGLQLGTFDFIKPYLPSGYEGATVGGLFGFQTDIDTINNIYTSLYLINTYIFAVPNDSSINPQLKKILESNHNHHKQKQQHLIQLQRDNPQQFNGNNTFNFTFNKKKRTPVPKPSEVLYPSSSSNSQMLSLPISNNNNNNNGQQFKKPTPMLIKKPSEQKLPTPPPPTQHKRVGSTSSNHSNSSSNNNSPIVPPPAIPPKRLKPKFNNLNGSSDSIDSATSSSNTTTTLQQIDENNN